jgi:hypothetical protein
VSEEEGAGGGDGRDPDRRWWHGWFDSFEVGGCVLESLGCLTPCLLLVAVGVAWMM